MECHSALNTKGILTSAMIWVNLKDIMSQLQEGRCWMTVFI